jgi:UrcA family protein
MYQPQTMECMTSWGEPRSRNDAPLPMPDRGEAVRSTFNARETTMYRFTSSSLIIATLGLISLAHAAPVPDAPQMTVHFADLDLTKVDGAAVLYKRLRAAAETVCGPREDRDPAKAAAFKKCVQSALASAVMRVDRAELAAYYRAHAEPRNTSMRLANK